MDFGLLDLIVVGLILLFGLLGLISGFLMQLFGVTALLAAWFLSRPVGRVVAGFITDRSSTSSAAAYVIGCFIAGIGIYVGAKIIFRIVNHFIGKTQAPSIRVTNRLLGGAFGGAKAFAIAWLALCVVAAFPKFFENKQPDLVAMLADSRISGVVEKWNPVKKSRLVGGAHGFSKVLAHDPETLQRLQEDPDIAEFFSVIQKKLGAGPEHEKVLEKIRAGDVSTILQLLEDPEVREAFGKIDLDAALTKVAQEGQ